LREAEYGNDDNERQQRARHSHVDEARGKKEKEQQQKQVTQEQRVYKKLRVTGRCGFET
jgi:hypothetical protein